MGSALIRSVLTGSVIFRFYDRLFGMEACTDEGYCADLDVTGIESFLWQ